MIRSTFRPKNLRQADQWASVLLSVRRLPRAEDGAEPRVGLLFDSFLRNVEPSENGDCPGRVDKPRAGCSLGRLGPPEPDRRRLGGAEGAAAGPARVSPPSARPPRSSGLTRSGSMTLSTAWRRSIPTGTSQQRGEPSMPRSSPLGGCVPSPPEPNRSVAVCRQIAEGSTYASTRIVTGSDHRDVRADAGSQPAGRASATHRMPGIASFMKRGEVIRHSNDRPAEHRCPGDPRGCFPVATH